MLLMLLVPAFGQRRGMGRPGSIGRSSSSPRSYSSPTRSTSSYTPQRSEPSYSPPPSAPTRSYSPPTPPSPPAATTSSPRRGMGRSGVIGASALNSGGNAPVINPPVVKTPTPSSSSVPSVGRGMGRSGVVGGSGVISSPAVPTTRFPSSSGINSSTRTRWTAPVYVTPSRHYDLGYRLHSLPSQRSMIWLNGRRAWYYPSYGYVAYYDDPYRFVDSYHVGYNYAPPANYVAPSYPVDNQWDGSSPREHGGFPWGFVAVLVVLGIGAFIIYRVFTAKPKVNNF